MISALLSTVAGKIGAVASVLILLGGGIAYHEIAKSRAYNRGHEAGVSETTERMKKVIEEQRKIATDNSEKWRQAPSTEKGKELKRRCVAACQEEPVCVKACGE